MKRFLVLAPVVATLLAIAPAAAAQEEPGGSETRITITLENSARPEIADSIAARLTEADGKPVGNAPVEFWIATNFLGDRYAFIGTAFTDATGVARLQLVPHRQTYQARATFDGDAEYAPTEASAQIRFRPQRVVAFAPEDPTQLGELRTVMPRAIGIVVAILWALLLGIWFVTVRRLRAARTQEPVRSAAAGGATPG